MNEFDQLCATLEQVPTAAIGNLLNEYIDKIVPAFESCGVPTDEAAVLVSNFMLGSCCADGVIDKYEVAIMTPVLTSVFGEKFTPEDAKNVLEDYMQNADRHLKETDKLVDLLGELKPEAKLDVVHFCLLMCALDGKITQREKDYVGRLWA